jgi:hypothetical protein
MSYRMVLVIMVVGCVLAVISAPVALLAGLSQQTTWFKTYGGPANTVCGNILMADDGGYFIVGTTNVEFEPEEQGDIYLLRTDAAGEVLWEKTYGGPPLEAGQGITQASDGDLLIAGFTTSAAGGLDAYLLKVDPDGNERWSRTYDGPLDERVGGIRPSSDGGYVLGGSSIDPDDFVADPGAAGYGGMEGRSSLYLLKVDDEGNELWSKVFDTGDNVLPAAGYQTPDGGFLALATITYFPEPDDDMLLMKIDADGNTAWTRTWDEGKSTAQSMILTADGNYLISAAYTPPSDTGELKEDYQFIKIDPDGNEIWNRVLGDPDLIDYGVEVVQATDGGYVAVGERTPDLQTWDSDVALVKIDEHGELVWQHAWPYSHTMFSAILQHPDGGYIITGAMYLEPVFQIILIKTDAQGVFED